MDAELNTNVTMFGPNLIGYPHIQEGGGTYNGVIKITDEVPKSTYKYKPTDDLSHIWETNNRDNIDDLDVVLRNADINSNTEYYGASGLNTISAKDKWDFGNFLEPSDTPCPYSAESCPKRRCKCHPRIRHAEEVEDPVEEYNLLDENTTKKSCFPTWFILIVVLIAVLCGMYFVDDDSNTPSVQSTS